MKDQLRNDIQQLLDIQYPDLIDEILNYIYTSLVKHDYSIKLISNIFTADVIDEYDLSDTSEYSSISELKESYLKNKNVDERIIKAITDDTHLIGLLSDIEYHLKRLLVDDLDSDDKDEIKKLLDKLILYESKSNIQSNITAIIERKLNLISVYTDLNKKRPNKEIYRFSYIANSYIPFTIHDLEIILNDINPDVKLLPVTYSNILARVSTTDNIKKSYLEFENIYLDLDTYTVIPKDIDNRYFTKDKLYYADDDNKLYHYYSNITIDDLATMDNLPYTIKVLKEITIPKSNPDDDTLFRFIIQLIGIAIAGKNNLKMLPIFLDDGSKGKTTIVNLLSILFTSGIETINQKVFNDTFTVETLNNAKYCFVNDEFKFKEFTKYNNEYKLLAGAGFYSGRGFMSSDSKKVTDLPVSLLFTNDIPIIDLNDTALIQRMLLITLPNKFIANDGINELKENEYYRNSNVINEIKSDYKGLSILLSIAINEYQRINKMGNIDESIAFKQSEKEKLSIISKQDPLLSFLIFRCKINTYNANTKNFIGTDDILNAFESWYIKLYNKKPAKIYMNKQDLGYKIKNTFKGIATDKNPARYNLYILSDDEAIKEFNKIISIIDYDYKGTELENTIINMIAKGNNTKNKILSELPATNKQSILTTIDTLNNAGIIDITVTESIV